MNANVFRSDLLGLVTSPQPTVLNYFLLNKVCAP
jgi:hypothetical protein